MGVFILMLIVVGVVVTVATVKSRSDNTDDMWRAAAVRLGLQFQRTDMMRSPKIAGTHRGLPVQVDTVSRSDDDSAATTHYSVRFSESLRLDLLLVAQDQNSGAPKTLGKQDIATADEAFDSTVVVKGRNPDQVKRFLTPSRRLRTVRFLTLYPGSTIDDHKIEFEDRVVVRDPDRIVQTVQRMTDLAKLLTEQTHDENELHVAVGSIEDGSSTALAGPLRDAVGRDERSIDDILMLERGAAQAGEALAAPDIVAITPSRQHSAHMQQAEENAATCVGSERAAATSGGETQLTVRSVVEQLFAPDNSPSQTKRTFEDRYEGRTVTWTGTLSNVRSFRFDLVFGSVSGTRAEFVFDSRDVPNTGRPQKAVVQFPPELEQRLRASLDSRVTFEGRLSSYDAFLRVLFLIDGQIREVDR